MTHVDNKMSSRALREEAWHRKVWGDKSCSSKPGAGYKRQSAIVELEAEREEAAGAKKGPCLSLTSGADMEGPGKAPGECGHSHPDKCVPGLLKCPTTRHTHRLFGMPFFFFFNIPCGSSCGNSSTMVTKAQYMLLQSCREPLPCRALPPQPMLDHYQTAGRPVSTALRMASGSNSGEMSIMIKILISKDHPATSVKHMCHYYSYTAFSR